MGRKTIGLLVDYLEMPYSGKLIEGCIEAAAKEDINLVIYPGTSINYNHTYAETDVIPERFSDQNVFQRTIVYEYAKRDGLDGFIIPIVTIGTCMSDEEKKEFIQAFGVPVMLLEQEREDVASLVFEQNGIELALKHLIEECGCKKIAYISGPLKNDDASYRIKEFRKIMAAYHLDFPESYIAYGDFTPFCQDVIEEMFVKHYKELDAIVVANDVMTTPLYEIMHKYGVIPGKDILVTGYDNSDIALESEPRLTTIKADCKLMSHYAVEKLIQILDGEDVGRNRIPIELIRRGSTGWKEEFIINEIKDFSAGIHNKDSMKNVFINSIATDMLGYAGNFEESMKSLTHDMKQAGFKECYFYMQEEAFTQKENLDWNLPNRHLEQIFYNVYSGVERVADGRKVDLNHLLSPILEDERQHTLVCYPVRMEEEHYGILYLGYDISFNMDVYSVANQLATAMHIGSLMKQLAAATEAKSNFLANMSHEIRTPINAVLGMDEMILRESKDEQITEYAMDIQSAGRTLLSLINDILDISKIESGKMELVNVEYDFSSLIHDVINMITIKADEKRLYLKLEADETLPSRLYGDDVRIRQILVNLLNNAVKYTNEGGVTLAISKVAEENEYIRILFEVRDTGIGIQKDDIKKLFQRFQRIEEQRNRNVEGTGLGMSIAIRFLDLMESQLMVDSEYGKGSVFSFELRQRIVKNEPIGKLQNRMEKHESRQQYNAAFKTRDARVLVVDDNAMNRKVFVQLLKETGLIIDTASSGKECLYMIKEQEYDVIFMDHMMPDMDGLETYQRMQTLEGNRSKDAKIVALTANAITGAREMYLDAGFDDYLTKPIILDKLEELLIHLLPKEKLLSEDEMVLQEEHMDSVEDFFARLSNIPEIRLDYARLYAPDETFLKDCIIDYYNVMNDEIEILQHFYHEYIKGYMSKDYTRAEKFLKEFGIKVHGMKSSSGLVGAMNLNGMAFSLEHAAYEGDYETIVALMPVFTKHWNKMREQLSVYITQDDTISASHVEEEIATTLEVILDEEIQESTPFAEDVVQEENTEVRSRILVVDDNQLNLKNARNILQDHFDGYYVSSGEDCLALLGSRRVDLILLDLHMPGMNGFEVLEKIKENDNLCNIPVIFLTADNNKEAELKGFQYGAIDFITKPFVADIMLQRINRILELEHLRRHLASEVAIQTKTSEERREKLERLSLQVMKTLAAAIDAKDRYTNGHSIRVAEYSRMLAKRMGKSDKEQLDIYYMALLHDVGKIGIPIEIINKPAALTDEEYEIIKTHPAIGAKILENISEIPDISVGAHWHHERFDGRGYPDGLAGYDIPEVSRIIGVCDAYDAMTSKRSYRGELSQEVVRGEIVRGMGTQFDPDIANYMLEIIDEDKEYKLRELS